jgi:uncharacterized protein
VTQATTLSQFIPRNQDEKIRLIRAAAQTINASLNPENVEGPPTDPQNIDSLKSTADKLSEAAGTNQGPGPEAARRLARLLSKLAAAAPVMRTRARPRLRNRCALP